MSKISIGLTQYIDFSLKQQAVSRANYVQRLKQQPEYNPAHDFWKQLRDALHDMHSKKQPITVLDALVKSVSPRKQSLYSEAVTSYKRFLKNKQITWFEPGKAVWQTDDLLVRTSPELGLVIDGVPHLVKLYFKGHGEKATKRSIAVTLSMMSESRYDRDVSSAVPSVLSTAQCKLFPSKSPPTNIERIALGADAQQLVHLWNLL